MLTVSVRNARMNLSKYLHIVEERGEEIIVKNHNRLVAKIVPCNRGVKDKSDNTDWLKGLKKFRKSVKTARHARNLSTELIVREERDSRG